MTIEDGEIERNGEWQREVHVASQWTEGRGWLRFHIGYPERTEALMQSLGGLHEVIAWDQENLRNALAQRFGEHVNPLQAVKIVIATLDSIDPGWREAEFAGRPLGGSASTIDFIDCLIAEPEKLPFNHLETY